MPNSELYALIILDHPDYNQFVCAKIKEFEDDKAVLVSEDYVLYVTRDSELVETTVGTLEECQHKFIEMVKILNPDNVDQMIEALNHSFNDMRDDPVKITVFANGSVSDMRKLYVKNSAQMPGAKNRMI